MSKIPNIASPSRLQQLAALAEDLFAKLVDASGPYKLSKASGWISSALEFCDSGFWDLTFGRDFRCHVDCDPAFETGRLVLHL